MTTTATFADTVRVRRHELGWSQERLAEMVDVRQTTVSRWEQGQVVPWPSTIRKLASALGVDVGDLMRVAGWDSEEREGAEVQALDRVAAKYAQLDARDQATIDSLLDSMLSESADTQ